MNEHTTLEVGTLRTAGWRTKNRCIYVDSLWLAANSPTAVVTQLVVRWVAMMRVWVQIPAWWFLHRFFCDQICVSFCNIFRKTSRRRSAVMHTQLWLIITCTASRVTTAALLSIGPK